MDNITTTGKAMGPDLRRPLVRGLNIPRSRDFLPEADAFIEYYAKRLGCPRNYMVGSVIFTVGVALGKKATIRVREYQNHANLYMAIVGDSGMNKSTPVEVCVRPLIDLDWRLRDGYMQAKKTVEEENRDIMRANRRKGATRQPLKPQPKEQSIYLDDTSPEKMYDQLAAIDNTDMGLMLYYDELNAMFNRFGRYNKNSELQDLLSLYNYKPKKVSRKGADTLAIRKPCISIIGTIQPNVLRRAFASSEMKDSGFNQRWLFVFPESDTERKCEYEEEDPSHRVWWSSFIDGIFNMQGTRQVTLSREAAGRYGEWQQALRDERNQLTRDGGMLDDSVSYTKSVLAKADIYCLRLALACHFLTPHADNGSISKGEMDYAIELSEYFISMGEQVQNLLEGQVNPKKGLIWLTAWLEAQKKGMTQAQFAKSQGISAAYLSKIIKQHRRKMG